MKTRLTALMYLSAAGAFTASIVSTTALAQLSPNATVFASHLQAPRGLKFGPDGLLYVAEAGTAGTNSTVGLCPQVPPPVGPSIAGYTSRISKIDRFGNVTTVASGFPSALNGVGDTQGVADVAFLEGKLYAVLAGAGCSHGNAWVPNAIVKVNTNTGDWKILANLSHFLMKHPAKYTKASDFEPDGTFYSLIAHGERLYTVEPNHGQILSISEDGEIREEIDISEAEGHIVPTSIAAKGDKFYVGNLGLFPITPESEKIDILSREECEWPLVSGFAYSNERERLCVTGTRAGFTTVVAVAFGPDGLLYALELSAAPGFPTLGAGKVVRLNRAGEIEDVATGLSVPTGMTFGPDGYLYVSNFGAAPAGAGQIVRITLP
ncbi:MAG: ScyD/ScyE family protein [Acidobacteriota bacterium]|nr:ScyD/ScyE family protein [Acidobacteriota bacterium]